MEAELGYESWDEKVREALGVILSRVSLQDGMGECDLYQEIDCKLSS